MPNPAVDAPRECMLLLDNLGLNANEIYFPNNNDDCPSHYAISATGWFNVGGYDYINGCARSSQTFSITVQQSFTTSTAGAVTPHFQETTNSAVVTDASDGVTTFSTLEFESDVRAKYARVIVVNGAVPVANAFNLAVYRTVR